jgi:hypothetical protein
VGRGSREKRMRNLEPTMGSLECQVKESAFSLIAVGSH